LKSGCIVGFEALVRWRHPNRGLIGPAEFIPVAEESDLIVELGAWVLKEACRQLATLASRYGDSLVMSVNVSSRQLRDPAFVPYVAQCLHEFGIRAASLTLEITEGVILDDSETTRRVLRELKDFGLNIQIDDFGTGYSSLAYLSRLQVDGIKIDRSVISSMHNCGKNMEVVHSIMALAEATGLDVVAEGIELQGQIDELIRMGCEIGQGFFYSPPLPRADAEALLHPPPKLPRE
jgi:EAL domain-containing protein (putative c-di-GMP-specific phosphodiesterase class I)